MTSSRSATIAQDLRERIALGEFGQTGALDSEAQLCSRYGVSRPTVRRALESLRDEGLLGSRPGSGWFVTGSAFHQRLAIGTFRHASSAVSEAGKSIEREVTGFEYVQATTALASALGVHDAATVLHVHSVRSVDGEGLDVVHEWVRSDLAGSISRDDARSPGIWETLARAGHRTTSVRQTVTAGLASATDAVQLAVPEGDPLLLVRRTALGADGAPIALSDHRYLARRFALEVEFNSGPASATSEPPGLRSVAP